MEHVDSDDYHANDLSAIADDLVDDTMGLSQYVYDDALVNAIWADLTENHDSRFKIRVFKSKVMI